MELLKFRGFLDEFEPSFKRAVVEKGKDFKGLSFVNGDRVNRG